MGIRKYISNVLGFFSLLALQTGVSLAAPGASTSASSTLTPAVTGLITDKPQGLAHSWLEATFGTIIQPIWGGPSGGIATQVTQVVTYANAAAMIMGVLIIAYTMYSATMQTAAEGEVLGKRYSTVWLPIRTSLGIGLLLPVGFTNGTLSAVQVAVIWLAGIGSNLGDATWNTAVDSFVSSAPVMTAPDSASYMTSKAVVTALTCAYSNQKYFDESPLWQAFDQNGNIVAGSGAPSGSSILTASQIQFGKDGKCGGMTFPADFGVDSSSLEKLVFSDSANETTLDAALRNAILQSSLTLINDAGALAMMTANNFDTGGSWVGMEERYKEGDLTAANEYFSEFENVVNNYSNSVQSNMATAVASAGDKFSNQFKTELKKSGWATAGIYFHESAKFSGAAQSRLDDFQNGSNGNDAGIRVCDPDLACGSPQSIGLRDGIRLLNKYISNQVSRAVNATPGTGSFNIKEYDPFSKCLEDDGGCDHLEDFADDWAGVAARWLLNGVVNTGSYQVEGAMSGDTGNGVQTIDFSASPFAVNAAMGRGFLDIASASVGLSILAEGTSYGVRELADSTGDVAGGIPLIGPFVAAPAKVLMGFVAGVLAKVGSFVLFIGMGLFGTGFVLAFMVPFLPMFTFMLVAIGWLIMVIEAVIISPLWWVMMLQPEGEGIAGSRLERGYGILQALVLKPMLLIMAMIAAIAVARIGFSLFNSVVWDGLDLFTDSGIFEFMGAVMIYTYGSYFVIKMTTGLIQQLPNSVLEWLNSSGRSFGEQEVIGQAEGHMRGGAQQAGGAIQSVGANKSGLSGYVKKKPDKNSPEESGGK